MKNQHSSDIVDYLWEEERICPICETGVCEPCHYLCTVCEDIQRERDMERDREIYYSQFDDEEEMMS